MIQEQNKVAPVQNQYFELSHKNIPDTNIFLVISSIGRVKK